MGRSHLDQDRDGESGEYGHFPHRQDEVGRRGRPHAQVGDEGYGRQDHDEEHPGLDVYVQCVLEQQGNVDTGQRDPGGDVEGVGEGHHPASEEPAGLAQPAGC
jgi:hypothetical protein